MAEVSISDQIAENLAAITKKNEGRKAILAQILRQTVRMTPPRILIYGEAGVGKTTFAANFPNPIFIDTENGLGNIHNENGKMLEISTFSRPESIEQFESFVQALLDESHEFKTLVVDSVDWLQPAIETWVIKNHPAPYGKIKSIAEYPYGAGYTHVKKKWQYLLRGFDALQEKRKMIIILTSHLKKIEFRPADGDPYDKYHINLQGGARDLLVEWADIVGFCKIHTTTIEKNSAFGQKHTQAISSGKHIFCCVPHPAFIAKNRYGISADLELKASVLISKMKGG